MSGQISGYGDAASAAAAASSDGGVQSSERPTHRGNGSGKEAGGAVEQTVHKAFVNYCWDILFNQSAAAMQVVQHLSLPCMHNICMHEPCVEAHYPSLSDTTG
eukprot:6214760-Pleurochrysis_carterae.AAC.1